MCGLVSVITKGKNGFSQKEVEAFSQLLYIDQVRGRDGTGIIYNVKKNKAHVRTLKAAYKSSIFVETKEYKEAERTLFNESNFVIGHNRAATKGKINVDCTHPFREDHITLVHNGTLYEHNSLDKDAVNDSHAICSSMAKIGYKETLKKIDGAFALIWFDTKERSLFLCRNIQRPLSIVECTTCFIIASEPNMAQFVANRNSLKVIKTIEVEPKKVFKFNLEDMTKWEEEAVEYRPFYIAPTHTAPTYEGDKYLVNKKEYKYGDTIRFKAAGLTKGKGDVYTLDGLINKWPNVSPAYLTNTDFEEQVRVKVYGTHKYLQNFVNKRDLVGEVTAIVIKDGVQSYILKNIKEKELFNIGSWNPLLEHKEHNWCESCYSLFSGKATIVDGMECCPKCTSIASAGCC